MTDIPTPAEGIEGTREVWVLLYLIDSDKWWPSTAPHNPNYFPDVHTYCFTSEKEAEEHRGKMQEPRNYWIKKTTLKAALALPDFKPDNQGDA